MPIKHLKVSPKADGPDPGVVHASDWNAVHDLSTLVAGDIPDFAEAVDDRVAALLKQGANITLTYDDAANSLTIASTASGGGGGGNTTTINDVAPATPVYGDRWIKPANMTEMVWVPNAGTSGTWINPADAGSGPSPTPISKGGTGATSAPPALVNLGIGLHEQLKVTQDATSTTLAYAAKTPGGYASLILIKAGTGANIIYGSGGASIAAAKTRWGLYLGDNVAETGSNTGSNFQLLRFDDAGVFIDTPLAINRATGAVGVSKAMLVPDGTVAAPALAFNNEPGLGMYRSAAGQLTWASGGKQVVNFYATTPGNTYLVLNPGAAGTSSIQMWSGAAPATNTDFFQVDKRPDATYIVSAITGTGTLKPVFFQGFTEASFAMQVRIRPAGATNAQLIMDHSNVGNASDIWGSFNGNAQWLLRLGAGGATNNFSLDRYNDAGAAVGAALTIDRVTAAMNAYGGVAAPSFTHLGGSANSSWWQDGTQVVFQFAANNYINLEKSTGNITVWRGSGTWTRFVPDGSLINHGPVYAGGDTSFGLISNGGFPYIRWAADNWRLQFNRSNGDLSYINQAGTALHTFTAAGAVQAAGTFLTNAGAGNGSGLMLNNNGWITFHEPGVSFKHLRQYGGTFEMLNSAATLAVLQVTDAGRVTSGTGYQCRNGSAGGLGSNQFNWMWNGANMYCFVDSTNQGWVAFNSDERIKRDIAPLESSEEAFMKLEPISFRWRNNETLTDTSVHHGLSAQNVRAALGAPTTLGNFEDDPTEPGSFPAGVDDRAVTAHLILRVQDLINRVQQLENA